MKSAHSKRLMTATEYIIKISGNKHLVVVIARLVGAPPRGDLLRTCPPFFIRNWSIVPKIRSSKVPKSCSNFGSLEIWDCVTMVLRHYGTEL